MNQHESITVGDKVHWSEAHRGRLLPYSGVVVEIIENACGKRVAVQTAMRIRKPFLSHVRKPKETL